MFEEVLKYVPLVVGMVIAAYANHCRKKTSSS